VVALTAVRDAIEGRGGAEDLNEEGNTLFYDLYGHVGPSPEAIRFFAEPRERGGGVGMDEHGRLVRGLPGGGVEVIKEAASNNAIE
jgi:hypothetical protein